MADYWKSHSKKYCKFCNCWLADNKPSIEFHENGSRHKENVAKRISEISKKSRKEFESSKKLEDDMKKMEEAAMKAYLKDVEAEADFTSKIIKEKAKQKSEESDALEAKVKDTTLINKETLQEKKAQRVWWEAKTDEGYTYYWNTESGESVWEPPEDGYISLAEQEEEAKKAEKAAKKKKEEEERQKKEQQKQKSEEVRAHIQREKMKEVYGTKEKEKVKEETQISAAIGPAPRVDPYGSWEVIKKKEEKPVDLQLPEQEFIAIKVPALSDEPKIKFKEKTVTTGTLISGYDDDSVSGFKKRKAAPGVKRNMRQRLDED